MPVIRKPIDPLQKAIPRNPKYSNIISTLDTGASITKYIKKLDEFRENFKIRDDEIFKRMKLTTFVQLILQIYEIQDNLTRNYENDTSGNKITQVTNESNKQLTHEHSTKLSTETSLTTRSTLESLIGGVGEHDILKTYFKPNGNKPHSICGNQALRTHDLECPYLLLDLRERDEYDACHIITAKSYPIAMLSRSINFETHEMLTYRNKPSYIILIYDDDERLAPRAATTLVQRGYSNLFLLSGGLRLAWKLFPEGLIIGQMPNSIYNILKLKRRVSKSAIRPLNSVYNYLQTKDSDSVSTISIASSQRTNTTTIISKLYCEIGSRDDMCNDILEEFIPQDLMHLTLNLEKHAIDGQSVRSSCARSTISSMNISSNGDRKPFR